MNKIKALLYCLSLWKMMVNGGMTVNCRYEGSVGSVDVDDDATVGDLRALAAGYFYLDPDSVRLSFAGRQLFDVRQELADAGIGAESEIIMHNVWHYSVETLRDLVSEVADGVEAIIPVRITSNNFEAITLGFRGRYMHFHIINGRIFSFVYTTS